METRVELLKAWINALRSGKYTQIRNSLRGPKGLSAMGVLHAVAHQLEMSVAESNILTVSERLMLTKMNDEGKTFPEIADYIEKEILTR